MGRHYPNLCDDVPNIRLDRGSINVRRVAARPDGELIGARCALAFSDGGREGGEGRGLSMTGLSEIDGVIEGGWFEVKTESV